MAACGGDNEDKASPSASITATAEATATAPAGPQPTPSPTVAPAQTQAGISLSEFAIKPDRTRARPGSVTFNVKNEGKLAHQFVVIKSDLPKAELPRQASGAVDETQVQVVKKIDEIAAGGAADVTVPVDAGKYILICNIFRDGVSHYLSGMYNSFTVDPTAPPGETPGPSPSS